MTIPAIDHPVPWAMHRLLGEGGLWGRGRHPKLGAGIRRRMWRAIHGEARRSKWAKIGLSNFTDITIASVPLDRRR